MRKRELIDRIQSLNATARGGFLSQFQEGELSEYLDHLLEVQIAPHPTARAISLAEVPVARRARVPIAPAPAQLPGNAEDDAPAGGHEPGQMALSF